MPVSIHLPEELLKKVDARAKRLGLTRSGYISRTLERDVGDEGGWSPGFFESLRREEPELDEAVEELVDGLERKSRKGPPAL